MFLTPPRVLNALRHQRYVQGQIAHTKNPSYCSAQRLTASKVCPEAHKQGTDIQVLACSTPYGIKGMSSGESAAGRSTTGGAQRLTASKVCPVELAGSGLPVLPGAQRLTASKVCPGKNNLGKLWVRLVLNALRHQRYVQLPNVKF